MKNNSFRLNPISFLPIMTSSSVPGITTGISESLPSWSSGSRVVWTDRFLLGEGVLFTCLPAEKNYQILICGLQSRYLYLRLYNTLHLDEIYQMCDRCVISEYNIDLFGVFAWGRSSSVWLPGPSLASLHEMAQLS